MVLSFDPNLFFIDRSSYLTLLMLESPGRNGYIILETLLTLKLGKLQSSILFIEAGNKLPQVF